MTEASANYVLGADFPAEWSIPPMALRYDVSLGKMLDEKRNANKCPMPYLRNVDVQWDKINTVDLPLMDIYPEERHRYELRQGDLLVCEGGEPGRCAIWSGDIQPCAYQKALHRLRPLSKDESPRYMYYLLAAVVQTGFLGASQGKSTISHLPAEDLRRLRLPRPPYNDQALIATFLDDETAKSDALIAKYEHLLELLDEKRFALIAHAITKGLNPDIAMKDTRIVGVGSVPTHWTTPAVWMLFSIGRGRVISHETILDNPGEYPVYSSQTENDGEMGRIATYDFDGDYLTWTTDGAKAGSVFERHGRFNCTNVCGTLKRRDNENNLSYLRYAIELAARYFVRLDINPKVMNDVMARIRLPLPPAAEQDAIAAAINDETRQVAPLIEKCQEAIALIREHRAALITSAVTGRIHMRSDRKTTLEGART